MLLISTALFALFALNVGLGSVGVGPMLGDVGEMLVLFATAIAFVVAILQREAAAKRKTNQRP